MENSEPAVLDYARPTPSPRVDVPQDEALDGGGR